MNLRPMFLGPPARSRHSSIDSTNGTGLNQAARSPMMNRQGSIEKLESLEMREAIYESHGIMASADKQMFCH